MSKCECGKSPGCSGSSGTFIFYEITGNGVGKLKDLEGLSQCKKAHKQVKQLRRR